MLGVTNVTTVRAYVATPEDAPGFWQIGNLWRVMATEVRASPHTAFAHT